MQTRRRQSAPVWESRWETTDNRDSTHTPEMPFDMCETLKAPVRTGGADDPDESARMTPGDLERRVDHDKVESQELEIKRMPSTLTMPGSAPDEKLGTVPRVPHPTPVDLCNATSTSRDGTSSAPPSPITYRMLIAP